MKRYNDLKSERYNLENKRKISMQEKGITLVALVVTIIVLLILAGVSITAAVNGKGIFARAQKAGNMWKEAEANETRALNELEDDYDKIAYEYAGIEKPILDDNGKEIEKPGDKLTTTDDGLTWRLFYRGDGKTYLKADPMGYKLSGSDTKSGGKKLTLIKQGTTSTYISNVMDGYKASEASFNFFKEQNQTWANSERGKTISYSNWDDLYHNEKAAIYLSDPDVWEDYKSDLEKKGYKVSGVWGAPSADLYCKAFNTQAGILDSERLSVIHQGSGYAYRIGGKKSTANKDIYTEDYSTGENSLTVNGKIDKTSVYLDMSQISTHCWWWLSSPSCCNTECVCDIEARLASLNAYNYYYTYDDYSNSICLIAELA